MPDPADDTNRWRDEIERRMVALSRSLAEVWKRLDEIGLGGPPPDPPKLPIPGAPNERHSA